MPKQGASHGRTWRHKQVQKQVLKQTGRVLERRDAQWVRYLISPGLSPSLARLAEAALERRIFDMGPVV